MSHNQVVMFRLNELYYGIDIKAVNEIVNELPILEIPNKPAHVQGVVNFREHIYTIVNSHHLLGMKKEEDKSQIIFLANGRAGLLVDEVLEIVDVTEDDKQSIENIAVFEQMEHIQYVIDTGSKFVTVIDLESMILPKTESTNQELLEKNQELVGV